MTQDKCIKKMRRAASPKALLNIAEETYDYMKGVNLELFGFDWEGCSVYFGVSVSVYKEFYIMCVSYPFLFFDLLIHD